MFKHHMLFVIINIYFTSILTMQNPNLTMQNQKKLRSASADSTPNRIERTAQAKKEFNNRTVTFNVPKKRIGAPKPTIFYRPELPEPPVRKLNCMENCTETCEELCCSSLILAISIVHTTYQNISPWLARKQDPSCDCSSVNIPVPPQMK